MRDIVGRRPPQSSRSDNAGRSAQPDADILQRLHLAGYDGGLTILKDYLQALRPAAAKPAFLILHFASGEAAQVDWGEFGDVFSNGTKVHAFVMVLCYCRQLYVEFTLRETLPTLLRCFERAPRFFGGRCREYWLDNIQRCDSREVLTSPSPTSIPLGFNA